MLDRTTIVVGSNLFVVAANELGDATAWDTIARENGLNDPFLCGLTTLVIPEAGRVKI